MKANKAVTFKRKLVYAAVASCFSVLPAYGNPIGATVVNGSVSFATQNNTLNITNTPNAIINWQQFNIQVGQTTRFIQQSAQSAVLNRVVGQDPSQILGSLLSNGRVFLINPNGIVFGADAIVDVAGLVASTLRLSDGDFLAGRMNFTDGVGAGSIVNQGNISTPAGGNIYLIAPDIQNSGVITSPQGEILLAAGHTVNLMDVGNPNVQVSVSAPATQAINLGTLMAQSGKIGLYASLIDQSGVINADSAVMGEHGVIRLQAGQDITLQPGSVTTASGMAGGVRDGGEIRIIADGTLNMRQGSEVHVDGGVDGGNGGFLELSGKERIALNGIYTGRAYSEAYHAGSLLIDPADINIVTSGVDTTGGDGIILATDPGATLNIDPSALTGAWLNVMLAATNDINVNSPITNTDIPVGGSLTLDAGNDININADIGAVGTRFNHNLTLDAGNDININASIYMGTNTLTMSGNNIFVSKLANTGDVIVDTLGNISVTALNSLVVQGGTANVTSNATLTANAALLAGGNVTLDVGAGGLSIQGGNVFASANAGVTAVAEANATVTAGGNLTITVSGPVVVMGGSVHAAASHTSSSIGVATASATANALLSAGGTLTINPTATSLTIQGGGGASASASDLGTNVASASANATVQANTLDITVAGDLEVRGGNFAEASASWGSSDSSITTNNTAALDANAKLHAITNATLTVGGNLTVAGGSNAAASGSEALGTQHVTANVNAELSAAGNLTLVMSGGSVAVLGGSGAQARASNSASSVMATVTLSANALLQAGNLLTISGASGLSVLGGDANASGSDSQAVNVVTAHADATVQANTITLTSGSLTIQGGNAQASASDVRDASVTATANATVYASGNADITISSADVMINGGSVSALASSVRGITQVTASANAALSAAGNLNLTLSGGEVLVSAGIPATATGSGSSAAANTTVNASTNALLSAGSLLTITGATGGLTIQGGGANATASHEHIVTATANANATVSAGTLTLASGDLLVAGGAAVAAAFCGSSAACLSAVDTPTANANANLQANTINILAGSLTIQGGAASAASGSTSATAYSTITATANANATVLHSSLNVFGPLSIVPGTTTTFGIGAFAFANAGVQLIPIPPVIPPVSSLPDPVITTINFTVGEINRSAPPRVLIEGIRYGDEGEEDYGKPECS